MQMASNQGKSKQGGSSQQHAEAGRQGGSKQAEAGRQSHKNDKNR
jgi:hypothetical protein